MENKINVLLVEDESVSRETLKNYLQEKENYEVKDFGTGREAIEAAEKAKFDIAILDLMLPDMSGLDVLKKIRKSIPDICPLIITGHPSIESGIEAIEEDVSSYIVKPFDINQIRFTIRRCLEKQKLILENKQLVYNLKIRKEKLESIVEIVKKMSTILLLDELSDFIIEKVSELTGAEKVSIMLTDENKKELYVRKAKGLDENIAKQTKLQLGEKIAGWAAKNGKPLLVENIETHSGLRQKNREQYKGKSFIIVPLKIKGKVNGVVNVADKKADTNEGIFTNEDLDMLSLVVHQAAAAIENSKLYEKITDLSNTDDLTGLYNYRYFKECLTAEIDRVKRYPRPLSLIMFDVDYFKKINDKYNHIAGNDVLKDLSNIMKKSIRATDTLCRYGGDEFAIILPESDTSIALHVAEKIRKLVEGHVFLVTKRKEKYHATISGGIFEYKTGLSRDMFIEAADAMLYNAKNAGRNQIKTE